MGEGALLARSPVLGRGVDSGQKLANVIGHIHCYLEQGRIENCISVMYSEMCTLKARAIGRLHSAFSLSTKCHVAR